MLSGEDTDLQTAESQREDAKDEVEPTLTVDYIKSNFFRVIHADGALGGVTPQASIQIDIFSERLAIPQQERYELTPEHLLGPRIERIGKTGLVREVEIQIVVRVEVAQSLYEWLGAQIAEAKERLRQAAILREPGENQND